MPRARKRAPHVASSKVIIGADEVLRRAVPVMPQASVLCCRTAPGWCGTWWNVSLEALEERGRHEETCRGTDAPVEPPEATETLPGPLEVANLARILGGLTGQLNRRPRFR